MRTFGVATARAPAGSGRAARGATGENERATADMAARARKQGRGLAHRWGRGVRVDGSGPEPTRDLEPTMATVARRFGTDPDLCPPVTLR